MTRQPTPLERFTAAVELAIKLPTPQAISRAILAGTPEVDDGLRAASYDGDRVTGGTSQSPVERMVALRNPDQFPKDNPDTPETRPKPPRTRGGGNRAGDDLYRLSKASERIVDTTAALAAICRDAAPPETWDEALWHADVLLGERCDNPEHEPGDHPLGSDNPHECQTLNTIAEALDTDHAGATAWADRFVHAVDSVRAIRDSWMAHDPTQGLAESNFAWCQNHARVGAQEKRITRKLCQWCWRHVQDLNGEPVELQLDPANWPSTAMMRAREDGRDIVFKRERQAWLRSHGVDPATASQRRQERRSA